MPFSDPDEARAATRRGWQTNRAGIERHIVQVIRRTPALTGTELAELREALDREHTTRTEAGVR